MNFRKTRMAGGALTLALVASACGASAAQHVKMTHATAASATVKATPARQPADPRLRVASPRSGARVGQTVTVHVSLTDGSASGSRAYKYVLDAKLTRFGSNRLTFHGLTPGVHHVKVSLVSHPAAHASVTFTVRAPVVPTAPVTTQTAPTTTTAPAPTTPAAPAPTTPAPAPPTHTTTKPAPPPPPPPPPTGGIPQHNGGDMDGDNNGAPSDGDGNI